jgi:hypothetical protein
MIPFLIIASIPFIFLIYNFLYSSKQKAKFIIKEADLISNFANCLTQNTCENVVYLNVRKYFEFLFDEIPNLLVLKDEALEEYLSWKPLAQEKFSQ